MYYMSLLPQNRDNVYEFRLFRDPTQTKLIVIIIIRTEFDEKYNGN